MEILWALSKLRTPWGDNIFQWITYFGQEICVIAVICFLYWCQNKRLAYQIGFIYFTSGLYVQTLKIFFRIPRPWLLDPAFKAVESAVPGATGYSFPSGHTQAATSLFAPLAIHTKKSGLRILFVCCFIIIGFSRLYLGVHTPKDVFASMGVSLFFCWLISRLFKVCIASQKNIGRISLVLTFLALGTIIYAISLLSKGDITIKYAADVLKAAGAGMGFAAGFYIERTHLDFKLPATMNGKVVRLFIGLVLTLLLQSLLKELPFPYLLSRIVEYFFLVFWVLVVYPYFFSRFSLRQNV